MFTVKINNKEVKFRKWKLKDKLKLEKAKSQKDIRDALVYDCLESKVILDDYEYQYILMQIRDKTLNTPLKYTLECPKCSKEFEYNANIQEVFKPKEADYTPIIVGDVKIELQSVMNQDFYNSKFLESETKELVDFILHIKSINGNMSMSFDEVLSYLNEMDLDVFEEIFKQWEEKRFNIIKTHDVSCPHCDHKFEVLFDTLPNFFPFNM